MEQEQENPLNATKYLLNQGALIGLALIAVALLFYVLDMSTNTIASWVTYVVFAGLLFWSLNKYRDELKGGYISYGQVIGTGVRLAFYAAILLGFYNYLFLSFVDASMIDVIMEESYNSMLEQGTNEDAANTAMEQLEMIMNPTALSLSTVLSTVFFGLIFSLVMGIFIKREDNEQFEEIE